MKTLFQQKSFSVSLLFCLTIFNSFSQSKKEQIEQLNYRVDSLKSLLSGERSSNAQRIMGLENTIIQLNQKITGFETQIASLNTQVNKLSADLQTNKSETATKQMELGAKQQEISNLKTSLQSKTDSLLLVKAELEKLRPAPKPVVSNTTKTISTNQITQTGSYKSVKIGTQTWMTENLNVSSFRNGDPIPGVKTKEEWEKAGKEGKPAWCYFDNDSKNGAKYGKLYNWYAVNDPRGLAPEGWHVPSDEEWGILENNLGDDSGNKMKSTSGWNNWEEDIICSKCKNWNSEYRRKTACHVCQDTRVNGKKTHSGNGTNSTGFSGLPGGWVDGGGNFHDFGTDGNFWSYIECSTNYAWYGTLDGDDDYFHRGCMGDKEHGFSVRCLRD